MIRIFKSQETLYSQELYQSSPVYLPSPTYAHSEFSMTPCPSVGRRHVQPLHCYKKRRGGQMDLPLKNCPASQSLSVSLWSNPHIARRLLLQDYTTSFMITRVLAIISENPSVWMCTFHVKAPRCRLVQSYIVEIIASTCCTSQLEPPHLHPSLFPPAPKT